MRNRVNRGKAESAGLSAKPSLSSILLAGLGGGIAIAVIAALDSVVASPLVLGSFGASCVLLFGFSDSPFSQPRNVILGHAISSFLGLMILALLGPTWWSVAIATGLAITIMMWTRTVHPPAGSNPVIIYLLQPDWDFLLPTTLVGSVLLVAVAWVFNNAKPGHQYPKYWF